MLPITNRNKNEHKSKEQLAAVVAGGLEGVFADLLDVDVTAEAECEVIFLLSGGDAEQSRLTYFFTLRCEFLQFLVDLVGDREIAVAQFDFGQNPLTRSNQFFIFGGTAPLTSSLVRWSQSAVL